MEEYIRISTLNDFIFCPKSIYYHGLYARYDDRMYHDTPQTQGKIDHATIDNKTYSTSKHIIQSLSIYSHRYGLIGKIDLLHVAKRSLMERKSHIKRMHPGYYYQLWAQYLCLTEMGYIIETLKCYSLNDNKVYPVPLPSSAQLEMLINTIRAYRSYDPHDPTFEQNPIKCQHCIYHELCDTYLSSSARSHAKQTRFFGKADCHSDVTRPQDNPAQKQ